MEKTQNTALKLAVQLAGGQQALAEICGCERQSINQAISHGRGLPARYVEKVSVALNMPKHILRPDLFPAQPSRTVRTI